MVQGPEEIAISEYMTSARQAVVAARKVLLSYFGKLSQVSEKDQAGLVSEADLESERTIKEILAIAHPEVKFLGEEESYQNQNLSLSSEGLLWVVDPLDGTTNYVHNFPVFCISIGLMRDGEMILGLIDAPILEKTYSAMLGGGAFVNGQPMRVSERKTVEDSLLATGFFAQNTPALEQQLKIFTDFIYRARGVRRAGAAAFDLCMVAEGVFDGFWEKNLQPWDTCGGALIVKEAGGLVTDYKGKDFHPEDATIVASNGHIHEELLNVTKNYN